jgi:hypothetical protein
MKVTKPLSTPQGIDIFINFSKREMPFNPNMRNHINVRIIPPTEFCNIKEEYADFNFLGYVNTANTEISLTPPQKTEYNINEELDLTGLVISTSYDGFEVDTVTGYTVTGYNPNQTGEQTITVTYKNQSADFTITVLSNILSNTVVEKTNDQYHFNVSYQNRIQNGEIIIAIFDSNKKLLTSSSVKINGSNNYSINIPVITGAHTADIFTWDNIQNMLPIGEKETIEL